MRVATFRAECWFDGTRVPELLKALNLNQTRNIDNADRDDLYSFHIPDSASINDLKETMQILIDNDTRFYDMHRCWQTLQEGYEPNEDF